MRQAGVPLLDALQRLQDIAPPIGSAAGGRTPAAAGGGGEHGDGRDGDHALLGGGLGASRCAEQLDQMSTAELEARLRRCDNLCAAADGTGRVLVRSQL
eukprot:COSAG01_NODE_16_length_40091_cov_15.728646_11_plen_99_part_00